MFRPLAVLVAVALPMLALLSGCQSAKVEETWKADDTEQLSFKRILVVATVADSTRRQTIENTLRDAIKSATVIPSYTVIADANQLKNIDTLEAAAREANADGIVVMRPISDRTEIKYTPGNVYPDAYASLRDYWEPTFATQSLHSNEDLKLTSTKRFIMIETNVYEAAGGKLLWSGTTELINPGSAENLVQDTVAALHSELRRQHLLP